MSEVIAVGCDVSKGRMDVVVLDGSGTVLDGGGPYDDTFGDHTRLRELLRSLAERYPLAEIRVAAESTGGYERNWLHTIRDERRRAPAIACWRLNPLAVKKWLDSDLHRAVNDVHAAHGIAAFLHARRPAVQDPEPTPHQTLYRLVRSTITQRAEVEQQFQRLLNDVHPELVQYTRHGLPAWLLAVVAKYPTAAKVAHAKPDKLAGIPHVTRERADDLIARAKTSVASMTGPTAEMSVSLLVDRIQAANDIIDQYQTVLLNELGKDPRVALIDSITGIGTWTAICLLLEIGDITRFTSCSGFIAWAGLDAHDDISGDGIRKRGISKRGNAHVRALLYMPAKCGTTFNPVIKKCYQRLRANGKHHGVALTACMVKLLRLVYAVLTTNQPFDPNHEAKRHHHPAPKHTTPAPQKPTDLTAPVSKREASRRRARDHKKAAAPVTTKTGSMSQEATGTDRQQTPTANPPHTKHQPAPAAGRHAGATIPTKTASEGPTKGRSGAARQRVRAHPEKRAELVT